MLLCDVINNVEKKSGFVKDCCMLIDDELLKKTGTSGMAAKAGISAIKGIKPGYISEVIEYLLPDFAEKLAPIWDEALKSDDAVAFFVKNKSRVAEAILSVTDETVKNTKNAIVRGTYTKLRSSANNHVEAAMPRIAQLLMKYVH